MGIKDVIEIIKLAEESKDESENIDGTFWSAFDNGAFDENIRVQKPDGKILRGRTDGYFSDTGLDSFTRLSTFEEAQNNFNLLKEPGKKSICLDIMGQGRIGYDLGADTSIGWTYKQTNIENLPSRQLKYGDLFDKKTLDSHIKDLTKQIEAGSDLNAVFWRAIGGLGLYYESEYALSYLYENLFKKIYALAKIGCKFYLSMRYGSPKDGTDHIAKLMKKLKELGFDILEKEYKDKGGNYILTKTSEKSTLPGLKTLFYNK